MAWIGPYQFMSAHGAPPELAGFTSDDITRPGVAGKAMWITGYKAEPYTVRTLTACQDAAGVVNAITAYKALQNVLVQYVDDIGNTWLNQWVHRVRPSEEVIYAAGGTTPGIAYILVCEWTLEHIG